MKKTFMILATMLMSISMAFAMSTSSIRTHARFLSDRMAYELDLSPAQYDDVYEINYDYIYMIDRIMDDVVRGYRDAIDRYYDLLDERNDDMRYVLTLRQYQKFIDAEYFYRPVYTSYKSWNFRIYTVYSNRNFFYYDAPSVYKIYVGAHARKSLGHGVYYQQRYAHQSADRYTGHYTVKGHQERDRYYRNDFGVNYRNRDSKQDKNNYKNPSQNNRTQDKRYEDKSGNKQSPTINNRSQQGGSGARSNGGTSTTGSRTGSSTSSSSGSRAGSSTTSSTGTRTAGNSRTR